MIAEPYRCDPLHTDIERLAEYVALKEQDLAPALRAWVREADRTCRANNALRAED